MRTRSIVAVLAAGLTLGITSPVAALSPTADASSCAQPTSVVCRIDGRAQVPMAVAFRPGAPSKVEQRLAGLGLTVPPVVAPIAAYAPAVQAGAFVYTSGQVPVQGGKLLAAGKVGAEITPEQATQLAQVAALNALAAVRSVVGNLDRVVRVVKVVGYVASAPGFTGQPGVVNGASNLLKAAFGDAGVHARSSVGVSELPLNAPVEIELIVEVAD